MIIYFSDPPQDRKIHSISLTTEKQILIELISDFGFFDEHILISPEEFSQISTELINLKLIPEKT